LNRVVLTIKLSLVFCLIVARPASSFEQAKVRAGQCVEALTNVISFKASDKALVNKRTYSQLMETIDTLSASDTLAYLKGLSAYYHYDVHQIDRLVDFLNFANLKMNYRDKIKQYRYELIKYINKNDKLVRYDNKTDLFVNMNAPISKEQIRKIVNKNKHRHNEVIKTELVEAMHELKLTHLERTILFNNIALLPRTSKQIGLMKAYILYSRVYSKKKKERMLNSYPLLFTDYAKSGENSIFVRFWKTQKKFDDFEKKKRKEVLKDMIAKGERIDRKEVKKIVKSRRETYSYQYLKCRHDSDGALEGAQTSSALVKSMIIGSQLTAMTSYSIVNWDKPKDSRWYSEFAYTQFMSYALCNINGKLLFSKMTLDPWKEKLPYAYLLMAGEDIVTSTAYDQIFSPSKDKLQNQLAQMSRKPDYPQQMKRLFSLLNNEKFKNKLLADLKGSLVSTTGEDLLPKLLKGDIDFVVDNLDNEKSQEVLLALLERDEYQKRRGTVFNTGDYGTDRYAYHRVFDLLSTPAGVMMSFLMYNRICMANNSRKGKVEAVLFYIVYRAINDYLYFDWRRGAVGQ
jgi:hypothetical protein